MDHLVVSTVVYRPPADVYDFLRDFSRFPRYSRYLKTAQPRDDAGDDPEPRPTPVRGRTPETECDGGQSAADVSPPGPPTRRTTGPAEDTEYDVRLAWWKLGCSVRSRVTEAVRPERIDWEIVEGVEASGRWRLSPAPESAERECVAAATRVRLEAEFDPSSAALGDAVSLPEFFDLDRAVAQVKPLLVREVERMVVRAVRDLEGAARDVTISVESRPAVSNVPVSERG